MSALFPPAPAAFYRESGFRYRINPGCPVRLNFPAYNARPTTNALHARQSSPPDHAHEPCAVASRLTVADRPVGGAMLPMSDGRCSLVWCHPLERREEVLSWSDEKFCRELQSAFGWRLGKITVKLPLFRSC